MAPIKFDKSIKDKLENRSINPSINSWDELSRKLDDNGGKRPNKTVLYMGVAASVIGILFMVNSFFNNSSLNNKNVPVLVDIENASKNSNAVVEKLKQVPLVQTVEKNSKNNDIVNALEITSEKNKRAKTKKLVANNSNKKNNLAINETGTIDNNLTSKTAMVSKEELRIDVASQNLSNDAASEDNLDLEIEQLLNQAHGTVTSVNNNKIDANSLLQDVEYDLDQSFRDKVFETLKTNIKKAATAVAERNN